MRIQHNISAMNAYRNYSNNNSALSKNLEKLSSGYRINRAGDDAAGLAISEKMRAQIAGLDQAQSNAKSGVNLVQTAEGALTEVHDMLNRMTTLADQSANGTYDNTTDRANLQKEVKQLKEEINRIADASNFNGINLLDGSMCGKSMVDTDIDIDAAKTAVTVGAAGTSATTGSFTMDLDGLSIKAAKDDPSFKINVGGTDIEVDADGVETDDVIDSKKIAELVKKKIDDDGAGEDADGDTNGGIFCDSHNIRYSVEVDGSKLKFTALDAPKTADGEKLPGTVTVTADAADGTVESQPNKKTVEVTNGTMEKAATMATTTLTLTKDMIQDGYTLKIGKDSYTFKLGSDSDTTVNARKSNEHLVEFSDEELALIKSQETAANGADADALIKAAAEKLSKFSDENEMFSIGHNKAGTAGELTLQQKTTFNTNAKANKDVDLTTEEGVKSQISLSKPVNNAEGKSLTLQIGESNDSFNKLTVDIQDMHTSSLGIEDVDISDQEGAQEAVQKIKDAINTVSSVRGTLGATQNRLEHTMNNLSVMSENISDAESTIRDTDVASEMMKYTKNNILVQSAQAMLAQANQSPQGVLQLLQ